MSRRWPARFRLIGMAGAIAVLIVRPAERVNAQEVSVQVGGTLQGKVLLSPRIASRRPRFRLYSEHGQSTAPPASGSEAGEMANVVIYFDSTLADGASSPEGARTMQQVNEAFAPHVLPVVAGSSVDFPNKDPFFHNVFSLSKPKTFDLGRYPQGASKRVRFDRAGVVQVFCYIHSDMSAIVFVVPNRFFTSPVEDGSYVIRGIPPGRYRVTAWHERARAITSTIEIRANQATLLDFNIPITDADTGAR